MKVVFLLGEKGLLVDPAGRTFDNLPPRRLTVGIVASLDSEALLPKWEALVCGKGLGKPDRKRGTWPWREKVGQKWLWKRLGKGGGSHKMGLDSCEVQCLVAAELIPCLKKACPGRQGLGIRQS